MAFCLLWGVLACAQSEPTHVAARADVVLMTLDTTRADHLGCYGYDRGTSPAIDGLAADGVRFEVAYAAAPVTLPSHASILTGQYPVHHGIRSNSRYLLQDGARTLAEVLAESGYQTAAFVSAAVLDGRYGLGQGFDQYGDDLGEDKQHAFDMGRRPAGAVVQEALEWLGQRDRERPTFVWLHFFDPHHPWDPPAELRSKFGSRDVDLYDAEIRRMDDAIGRFRDALPALGMEPVWAVLSDHGEGLSDHGEETHGSFVYETTTRIAFILAGGGLEARTSATVARQIDLLPTVLELVGVSLPPDVDGLSLIGRDAPRRAYIEARLGYEEYGWSPVHALVEGGWKYVDAPRPELFDLSRDPHEAESLIDRESARAAAMRSLLLAHLESGEVSGADGPGLDAAHIAALQALGYTGGGAVALPGEQLPDPKDMLEVSSKLGTAKSLLVSGPARDAERAFALLEEILRVNPANRDALSFLGREAWREASRSPSHPKRALFIDHSRRAFERIRVRAPDLAEGEFGLGLLAMLEGDVDSAAVHYGKAVVIEPRHVEALENLMRVRHSSQEWSAAIDLSARILAIDEAHHDALQFGGLAHFRAGDSARAIGLLKRLLPARDRAEANGLHFVLGECERREGNYRVALDHYGQVQEPDRSALGLSAIEARCREALE